MSRTVIELLAGDLMKCTGERKEKEKKEKRGGGGGGGGGGN